MGRSVREICRGGISWDGIDREEEPEAEVGGAVVFETVMRGEPVGNKALALGLHKRAGLGGDRLVEFDLGVEIAAFEKNFVAAAVTKGALEGLVTAGMFHWGDLAAAAGTAMAGTLRRDEEPRGRSGRSRGSGDRGKQSGAGKFAAADADGAGDAERMSMLIAKLDTDVQLSVSAVLVTGHVA